MVSWEEPQQQPRTAEAPSSARLVSKLLFRGTKYFHKASCLDTLISGYLSTKPFSSAHIFLFPYRGFE